jgi:hypothetical protein
MLARTPRYCNSTVNCLDRSFNCMQYPVERSCMFELSERTNEVMKRHCIRNRAVAAYYSVSLACFIGGSIDAVIPLA